MCLIAFFLYKEQQRWSSASAESSHLKTLVNISDSGLYVVTYPRNLTETDTFAALAQLMLPVWFEASLISLSVFTSTVDPSDVHNARKCLLTTRDLLDVFSPVYSNRNPLWQDLRGYYKHGYELAGSFQDLHDGHVTFDQDLWHLRRQALLEWKVKFERHVGRHNLRYFLLHPSQSGCFDHKESHLFWAELAMVDTDHPLPCGNDLATTSLQQLAVVQLNNALDYLGVIMEYDVVLSREHQLQYHNFRKEIRSFVDEYNLFGFVLFPSIGKEDLAAIDTLIYSRLLLGELNDHWEAFNLYRDEGETQAEQPKLVKNINMEWNDFKEWSQTSNLSGAIQSLVKTLSSHKAEREVHLF